MSDVADRAMAREIAHRVHVCYRDTKPDENDEHSPACNRLADAIESALAAVRSEARRAALEEAAKIAASNPAAHIECDHGSGYMNGRLDAASAIRFLDR